MAKRKYENKKLKKYFEKYIKRLSVEDKYKPMLVDILMRRADTFDLSGAEIRQDVVSILNNLDSIVVTQMPQGFETAWGVYTPWDKEVTISESLMDTEQDTTKIYQTITHEIYHALARDENGNDRMARYNSITGEYNSALLEAIVEKASYRAVFGNDRQVNGYYNKSARGYGDITFIVDVLEATYGVSEKEFLKNGIMGREKLAEFLAERSGETPESAYTFLDSIEANYALVHHSLYPAKGQQISPYQIALNLENGLTGIYNLCESKMAERIENSKYEATSYEDVDNLNDELRYDHNKLTAVMGERLDYFSKVFDHSLKKNVCNRVAFNRYNNVLKVNNINDLVEAAPNFSDETNFMNGFAWAVDGQLGQLRPEILSTYGINIKLDYMLPITEEIFDRALEEDATPEYDNSKVPKLFKKIKNKDKGFFRNGLDKIKSLFSRKDQKLLSAGGNQAFQDTQPLEINTIFPQLTKEEQEMYNMQVRHAVESLDKNTTTAEVSKEIENEDR